MAWCPKCKNEYREGITVCADCGCLLVREEELTERTCEIPGDGEENFSDAYDIDEQEASCASDAETLQSDEKQSYAPYRKNADKAEDNRSSAWTLLAVGALGMLVMLLGITGRLPFRIGNPYMFYGVMSAIFFLFIVMGVISMKNAKLFAKKAESENSLIEALEKWCEEHLNAEDIDAAIGAEEDFNAISDEILYFRRYEKLKEEINYQFMHLDQALLESLIDEKLYDMVFGK